MKPGSDWVEVLRTLSEAHVRYLVVGQGAMVLQGIMSPRPFDLELLVEDEDLARLQGLDRRGLVIMKRWWGCALDTIEAEVVTVADLEVAVASKAELYRQRKLVRRLSDKEAAEFDAELDRFIEGLDDGPGGV